MLVKIRATLPVIESTAKSMRQEKNSAIVHCIHHMNIGKRSQELTRCGFKFYFCPLLRRFDQISSSLETSISTLYSKEQEYLLMEHRVLNEKIKKIPATDCTSPWLNGYGCY